MPRSPEAPRFKRILKKAERIGAAGLAATSLSTGIDAAISSASAKAPEAAVASPSKSFKLETPQDILKSVQAELATKDKKPKGDKGKNQEAQGATTTTLKEQEAEMEKDIKAVAKSMDATLKMTPEEFHNWTLQVDADGKNNVFNYVNLPDGTSWTWDFPVRLDARTARPTDDGFMVFNEDYSIKYPRVEHLGLVAYNPNNGFWVSLAILNGSVTVPLTAEPGGFATISFATSIWPDGRKIPYAWVSNLNSPNNPLLGPNQALMTDFPVPNSTPNKNQLDVRSLKGHPIPREEFITLLEENVGKPIEFAPHDNQLLQYMARYSAGGSYLDSNLDARIPGIEANQFAPIFDALANAYFDQSPAALDSAVAQGEAAGIFLPTTLNVPDLRKAIKSKLTQITDLQTVFSTYPFGATVFLPDSTSPLTSSSSVETASVKSKK